MKTLLATALLLTGALGLSGMAHACTGACAASIDQADAQAAVSISQTGSGNGATVSQTGSGRASVVLTQDNASSAPGNGAEVVQSGSAETDFTGRQSGSGNQLTAVQAATAGADRAEIDQIGLGNVAGVYQNYNPQTAAYTPGGGNTASIYQGGLLGGAVVSDQASVVQTGSKDTATVNQFGSHDTASAIQTGSNDSQSITQFGDHDSATYAQNSDHLGNLQGVGIVQTGSYMSVSVTQSAAGAVVR